MPIFPTDNAMCTKIAIELKLRRSRVGDNPTIRVRDAVTGEVLLNYDDIPSAAETSGVDIRTIMNDLVSQLKVINRSQMWLQDQIIIYSAGKSGSDWNASF